MLPKRDEAFPKSARLTRRSDFVRLSRGERKFHTPHFIVLGKPSQKAKSRLGITVSAQVGKAVFRNRLKRLVRECFRRNRSAISSPHDVVVIAKRETPSLALSTVEIELIKAFSQIGGQKTR